MRVAAIALVVLAVGCSTKPPEKLVDPPPVAAVAPPPEPPKPEGPTIEDRLPTPERNWTIRQVAERIGISYEACKTRVARGQIKAVDVDGHTLVPDAEVRRLIQRGGKP